MDLVGLGIELSKLALFAIIMWHIPPFIGMAANATRICQALIVLIAIFAAIGVVIGGERPMNSGLLPPNPLSPSHPSVIR